MRNAQATVLYQWFTEVWNNENEGAIDQLMDADAITDGVTGEAGSAGGEGFRIFYRDFRDKFSQIQVEVPDVIKQDDMEAARCVVHATDKASGQRVTFSGICMVRVRDGKITEAWNNFDFLSLYRQLGQELAVLQS